MTHAVFIIIVNNFCSKLLKGLGEKINFEVLYGYIQTLYFDSF